MTEAINDILGFWFGELDEQGLCVPEQHSLWFKASDITDQRCRQHFGDLVDQAILGGMEDWVETDEGLMALIILLDQFTRNIYRGTPQAFAGDARALGLAQSAIESGRHRQLPAIYRVFLYLPLEHSELMGMQETCVSLFTELEAEMNQEQFSGFRRYADAHHNVIAEFGRFPHRNTILQRDSSEAELQYLETHGGF